MRTLIVALALMSAVSGNAFAQTQEPAQITVSATATIETAPDMASLSLGVETRARTAAQSLRGNSADVANILKRVKDVGISDDDVQTSGLSLSPVYQRNSDQPNIIGYVTRNQINIRVRDLTLLGPMLDEMASQGANIFNGLSFGLQDDAELRANALTNAVKNARAKAELMTNAAGVSLGRLTHMSENGGRVSPMPMAREMAMMADAPVPIAEGAVAVSATVTLTFEIIN